jgi:thymidine kinase
MAAASETKKEAVEVEIKDDIVAWKKRQPGPPALPAAIAGLSPGDHQIWYIAHGGLRDRTQQLLLETCRRAILVKNCRGLLVSAFRQFGKTHTLLEVACQFACSGMNIVYIAPSLRSTAAASEKAAKVTTEGGRYSLIGRTRDAIEMTEAQSLRSTRCGSIKFMVVGSADFKELAAMNAETKEPPVVLVDEPGLLSHEHTAALSKLASSIRVVAMGSMWLSHQKNWDPFGAEKGTWMRISILGARNAAEYADVTGRIAIAYSNTWMGPDMYGEKFQ